MPAVWSATLSGYDSSVNLSELTLSVPSVQQHTVLITEEGVEILTLPESEH
jgi:methionine aminopeptidase